VILADENIDKRIIDALRETGFEVYSIKEDIRGVSDEWIIQFSKNQPWIILTNDKDFGGWVFAHNQNNVSVVFLRYQFPDRAKIIDIVVKLFQEHETSLHGKFTTVTVKKIRTTKLR
jgi:predicted nuclease of predicted toxin-antitoxin system